ncbi:MAG TPA: hypothetical protein VF784_09390 [Anaerolineales bacterium]
MRIVKNEGLIKRNAKIGQYTSLAALVVLGIGMYISVSRTDLFVYAVVALILGFVMTQIGMFFSNRWGRSPRPDEQLDAALKGLPGDTALYHYMSPVPHLLVGPAGVWILQTYHQRGKVSYSRNRWRLSGGGFMQTYMSIFGQEGLGRPELDLANETSSLRKFFTKELGENAVPEIGSALVFTNDQAEIDATGAPTPAMKIKQLKEFLRQKAKERPIEPLAATRIKSLLDGEEQSEE